MRNIERPPIPLEGEIKNKKSGESPKIKLQAEDRETSLKSGKFIGEPTREEALITEEEAWLEAARKKESLAEALKTVEEEKNKVLPEKIIEEKRQEYLLARQKFLAIPKEQIAEKTKAELKAESLQKAYEQELTKYAKTKLEEKKKELAEKNLPKEESAKELNTFIAEELIKNLFIKEQILLEQKKKDSRPFLDKIIHHKLIEKWIKIPPALRWGISALLATGIAVSGGIAVGVPAAAAFFGIRFGRAALSTLSVIGTERGLSAGIKKWEKTIGEKKTREFREKQWMQEMTELLSKGELIEHYHEMAQKHQQIIKETARRERRQNIAKWTVAIAVGGSAMIWGGVIDRALGLGKPPVSEIIETKKEVPVSPEQLQKFAEAQEQARLKVAHLTELATVKKGEGAWQAVYRQLEDQIKGNPTKFNLRPEDLENAAKVKQALNTETAKILVENKFIRADGTEIRISEPGTKIILDGKHLEILGKTYEWQPLPKTNPLELEYLKPREFTPIETQPLAETLTAQPPKSLTIKPLSIAEIQPSGKSTSALPIESRPQGILTVTSENVMRVLDQQYGNFRELPQRFWHYSLAEQEEILANVDQVKDIAKVSTSGSEIFNIRGQLLEIYSETVKNFRNLIEAHGGWTHYEGVMNLKLSAFANLNPEDPVKKLIELAAKPRGLDIMKLASDLPELTIDGFLKSQFYLSQ